MKDKKTSQGKKKNHFAQNRQALIMLSTQSVALRNPKRSGMHACEKGSQLQKTTVTRGHNKGQKKFQNSLVFSLTLAISCIAVRACFLINGLSNL